MIDVWTFGETMISLRASGPLGPPVTWTTHVAGAESTVAIGLTRLGHSVRWYSRVGADQFGTLVTRELRAEGVQTGVEVDEQHPTGFMFLTPTGFGAEVSYHRSTSAASMMGPAAADDLAASCPRMVVVSGITPALGEGPAAALDAVLGVARQGGVTVVLDVNHRARLWSREHAAQVLGAMLDRVDVLIGSPGELDLWAAPAQALLDRGPREIVVKLGARGAHLVTREGLTEGPTTPVAVVDAVGAGDAFTAGYVSALLDGLDPEARLVRANLMGSAAVQHRGDWEGLPRRADLLAAQRQDQPDVVR